MNEILLETHGLTKQFRRYKAVNDIDMHIRRGAIYGFIGRNGAGKTTFLKMVCGLANPTAGEYSIFGCTGKELAQVRPSRTLNDSKDLCLYVDHCNGAAVIVLKHALSQGLFQFIYFLRYSLGVIETYFRKTREKCPGEENPRQRLMAVKELFV